MFSKTKRAFMRLLRTVLTRPEGTQRDKMKPGFRRKKKETPGAGRTTERASCPGAQGRHTVPGPISIVLALHLKLPTPSAPIHLAAQIRNPVSPFSLVPESAPHHITPTSEMFKESIHLSSAHCLYPGQGQPGPSRPR